MSHGRFGGYPPWLMAKKSVTWEVWWLSSLTPAWAISHIGGFFYCPHWLPADQYFIGRFGGFPQWLIARKSITWEVWWLSSRTSWLRNQWHGRFGDCPHWRQAEQSVTLEVWWLSSLTPSWTISHIGGCWMSSLTPGWAISHMEGLVIGLTDSRLSNQSQLTDRIKNPGLGVRSSQWQEKVPVIQQILAIM